MTKTTGTVCLLALNVVELDLEAIFRVKMEHLRLLRSSTLSVKMRTSPCFTMNSMTLFYSCKISFIIYSRQRRNLRPFGRRSQFHSLFPEACIMAGSHCQQNGSKADTPQIYEGNLLTVGPPRHLLVSLETNRLLQR